MTDRRPRPCPECGGSGEITTTRGFRQPGGWIDAIDHTQECPECGGSGEVD